MMQLLNAENGDVLLHQLEIADTFWKRFKGLQLRKSMPRGSGLLLTPCSSLHTCFMRFPVDVIMLTDEHVVLGMKTRIRPWRAVICDRGTSQVIEVCSGSVEIATGTKLVWMDTIRNRGIQDSPSR